MYGHPTSHRAWAASLGLATLILGSLVTFDHPPARAAGPPSGPRIRTGYASRAGPGVPIANGHLNTINIDNGQMTDLGLPVGAGSSIAWDPLTSRLLGFRPVLAASGARVGALYDLTTMPGVELAQFPVSSYGGGFSRDPSTGRFYYIANISSDAYLYEIDAVNLRSRFIGYQWGVSTDALAIDSQGRAYATMVADWKLLYRVDLATGQMTTIGPLNAGIDGHPSGMCFDSTDTLWLLSGGTVGTPARLFTVDTMTGQATFQRNTQISGWYSGLAILP